MIQMKTRQRSWTDILQTKTDIQMADKDKKKGTELNSSLGKHKLRPQ